MRAGKLGLTNQILVAEEDLVSIVVPVYKVEAYIEKCLLSIINQTYCKLEIILVDDGSPDRCGSICDGYATNDPRIRVIHKLNGGLSDARNAGLEVFSGSFLSFVDGDDWISPDYVATLLFLAKSRNAEISACDFFSFYTEKEEPPKRGERVLEFSGADAVRQYQGPLSTQMVITCAKLYERRLFDGIRFPVGRLHEDEFTTYKLLYRANRVVFTSRPLLWYRQRPDSIMGNLSDRRSLRSMLDAADALLERVDFFEARGARDLADAASRGAFIKLLEALDFCRFEKMSLDALHDAHFRKLRNTLRLGSHELLFRIFFEGYYIAPRFFGALYRTRRAIKNCFKKIARRLVCQKTPRSLR